MQRVVVLDVAIFDTDGRITHRRPQTHGPLMLVPDEVEIAQEQLGHASISTTLNIYTHVVDASHRKARCPACASPKIPAKRSRRHAW